MGILSNYIIVCQAVIYIFYLFCHICGFSGKPFLHYRSFRNIINSFVIIKSVASLSRIAIYNAAITVASALTANGELPEAKTIKSSIILFSIF